MPTAQVGSPTPTSQQAPCRAWGWSSAQKAPPPPSSLPPALPVPAGFRMGWSVREEEPLSLAPCCCPPTTVPSRCPRRCELKLTEGTNLFL